MSSISTACAKLLDSTPIPVQTKDAESLIRTVIQEDYSDVLNIGTFTYAGAMGMHMYSIYTKTEPSKYLNIWVNTSGLTFVEAMDAGERGMIPYFYNTVETLRVALKKGLGQLFGTSDE
jgi:hypothetical protein